MIKPVLRIFIVCVIALWLNGCSKSDDAPVTQPTTQTSSVVYARDSITFGTLKTKVLTNCEEDTGNHQFRVNGTNGNALISVTFAVGRTIPADGHYTLVDASSIPNSTQGYIVVQDASGFWGSQSMSGTISITHVNGKVSASTSGTISLKKQGSTDTKAFSGNATCQ